MERLAAEIGRRRPRRRHLAAHARLRRPPSRCARRPRWRGDFGAFRCPEVGVEIDNDVEFVELLLERAAGDGGLAFDAARRRAARSRRPRAAVLPAARRLVNLSVVRDYEVHRDLGRLVRETADELGRDVLFVASGDMSHRLQPGAPAGYDPRGALFDAAVVELLGAATSTASAASIPSSCDGAGECGLRWFIALGGFLGDDADPGPRCCQLRRTVRRRLRGRRASERRHERRAPPPSTRRRSDAGAAASVAGPADYARRCVEAFVGGRPAPPPPADAALRAGARPASARSRSTASCAAASAPSSRPSPRSPRDRAQRLRRRLPRPAFPARRRGRARRALTYSVDVLSPSEPCDARRARSAPLRRDRERRRAARRAAARPGRRRRPSSAQLAIALQKAGIAPGEPYDHRALHA